MAKAEFKKKTLFTSKLYSNLRKKLVNCYIWSRALQVQELGHFGKWVKNTWKILKCGDGKG